MSSELERDLAPLLQQLDDSWKVGRPITIESLVAGIENGNQIATLNGTTDGSLAPQRNVPPEIILELVQNEVFLRESAGEIPQLDEYQRRFPDLAGMLEVQWQVYETLDWPEALKADYPRTAPDRIDRYQIQTEVGRGAMGVVYRAWDTQLKRTIAIKRLRSGVDASHEDLNRIHREAEAAARIRHENVVQIYDVGDENGQPFLAIEYCSGGSLATMLSNRPLPARDAAQLVSKIANGVAAAHAVNVLHRDLKPANVLLSDEHKLIPKVSDFGLAKQTDADDRATASGSILGSPAYMAPEQAQGDIKHVGRAADIYAIGAILYECLTGRPPFRGATITDTLDQVRHREPVGVRHLQPKVPLDLETITHKCLRKDPNQRYASAEELAEDLGRFLRHEPIHARRETLVEASVRTFYKHPKTASLAATAVGLLLLITIGSLIAAQRLRIANRRSEAAEREARIGQADALVGRARGIRLSQRPGHRFEALAAIRQAAAIGHALDQPDDWFLPLRNEAASALCLPDAYVEKWREEHEDILYADASHDGKRYAISFTSGDIQIRDAATHSCLARVPRGDKLAYCNFIDNDRLLVRHAPSQAFELWSIGSDSPERVWRFENGCGTWDVSSDGRTLAVGDRSLLTIVDVVTGSVIAQHPIAPYNRVAMLTLHPTHPYIGLCSYFYHGHVQIRNWKTGETIAEPQPKEKAKVDYLWSGIDWSPDGRTLAAIDSHGHGIFQYAFDPEVGSIQPLLTLHPNLGHVEGSPLLEFNATGDRILTSGWTSQTALIDAISGRHLISSEPLHALSSMNSLPWGGLSGYFKKARQFGPISMAEGYECQFLNPESDYHVDGTFDGSSKFIVTVGTQGIQVHDANTFQVLLDYYLPQFWTSRPRFVIDGEMLLASGAGVFRWPYSLIDEGNTHKMKLAIPQRVHVPGGAWISASRDCNVVAAGLWNGMGEHPYAGAWLKTADEPAARRLVGDGSGSNSAVSTDGKFAIVCTDSKGFLLFDCTSSPVTFRPIAQHSSPKFSRDGLWRINGKRRMKTGDWDSEPEVDPSVGTIDISGDGRHLLTSDSSGALGWVDAESGKSLVKFDPPERVVVASLSPDANRAICLSNKNELFVLDMLRIRKGLAELDLDWVETDGQVTPIAPKGNRPKLEVTLAPELKAISTSEGLLELVDRRAMQAAEDEPSNAFAAFDAAMAAIRNRQMKETIHQLDRACELLPNSITARQWRAYSRAYQRDYAAAIADADWVLNRIEDGDLQLLRAEWHYREGQYDDAVADCSKVIETRTYLKNSALGLLAECHRAAGDAAQAEADQKKFLADSANDSMTLNLCIYPAVGKDISLRQPIVALKFVEKLLQLDEELKSDCLNSIAFTYYYNDRFEEAVQYFDQSLAKLTDSNDDHTLRALNLYGLAMAYHQLGNLERRQEYFQLANQWQPTEKTTAADRELIHVLRAEIDWK